MKAVVVRNKNEHKQFVVCESEEGSPIDAIYILHNMQMLDLDLEWRVENITVAFGRAPNTGLFPLSVDMGFIGCPMKSAEEWQDLSFDLDDVKAWENAFIETEKQKQELF